MENIIAKLENILESFRSREKTVAKMWNMLETIIDGRSLDDDEFIEVVGVIKERFPEELIQLE